jgi:predicted nucleic acid-binding protein
MRDDAKKTYWDSCVFISALDKKDADRVKKIVAIERQARSGEVRIFVSALVLAEVVRTKEHGKMTESEIRIIQAYFQKKFVSIVPVDRIIAKAAADIVRNNDLKPLDAIHLATAIRCGCEVFYTYDGDGKEFGLLKMDGQIGVPAMPIKRPGDWGQITIDMIGESRKKLPDKDI